ncbi:hypothetical protein EMIHUDRAFT_117034 [Emiliania huxleyi CCMP1516]|uniref:PhoH-like protein n=2 Tax=Emiliania huxleyi TaxID=2903 RepID=A0A0D3JE70_EMIH1|nr:hypothetical protein EMIHUDRAFT_117034 [Emiliania huxleyi CCMP1516]EOD21805.1 hypothetical protein EMIHUDRAFT_117034 [Emiliania huxleyi CCMP1516]|eukprot:XP_005774234.1 hypothetical protein EMIHUDRAFT_117034 [Emiliania huxleyi CCMP1516]
MKAMKAVLRELRRSWAPLVRSYLERNGGSAPINNLGGAVQLPQSVRGQVRFAQALTQCEFQTSNGIVLLPNATLSASRRPRPTEYQTLESIIGARRGREDEEDEEARRPAQRRRTAELAWGIDLRPSDAHVPPDEASRRSERAYRFGTSIGGHAGGTMRDGLPSRPPGVFDWSRYALKWRSFEARDQDQERYMQMLSSDDVGVVVGFGKAGTGKTLLASPPARTWASFPLLDAIDKFMGDGAWVALQNKHLLELQSFAYMRGRTHERAFVIADEVQNASCSQLKLLATRVGEGSRLCILGDGLQPDRRVGGNWAGGGPSGRASSIELFVDFVESGGLHRADLPAQVDPDACVKIARLRTCQRSDTAAAMLAAMERFEHEVMPAPRPEHGQSAASLLREAVAQAGRE